MKKICLFKIIFAVFQLKKTAAAVVATSLSSRGNKRETRQWQKAVTLLALGFVLCVQGIAGGEGKGQDPPPRPLQWIVHPLLRSLQETLLVMTLVIFVLHRWIPVYSTKGLFSDRRPLLFLSFWGAHIPVKAVIQVRRINEKNPFCLGDQSHTVNNRQH